MSVWVNVDFIIVMIHEEWCFKKSNPNNVSLSLVNQFYCIVRV